MLGHFEKYRELYSVPESVPSQTPGSGGKHNAPVLPTRSSAVKKIVIVNPSSAAAISLLVQMFGD